MRPCAAVGVALTAEFTAVGDLFEIVIGTLRWPIVVIIGVISAIYTAYGGLYVSIVTDQVSFHECSSAFSMFDRKNCNDTSFDGVSSQNTIT